MKLYVKSKEEVEAGNDLTEPHVIVSINFPPRENPIDGDDETAKPVANEYTKEILSLFFLDVGRLSNPLRKDDDSPEYIPFNKEMAWQVLDLIERNNVEHVIIHCLGGISRSASMADAISIYFNDKKAVRWIVINDLVYQTMLEALVERYG